jgi:hypothetical protein
MEPTSPPAVPAVESSAEDNTVAIVAYITLIGFIIAIVMHGNKKTQLGAYHLRQVLGLFLTGFAGWIALMVLAFILAFIPVAGPILVMLIWFCFGVGLLVCWVMGLIAAINRQMKPMPLVGPLYEKWFGKAFG